MKKNTLICFIAIILSCNKKDAGMSCKSLKGLEILQIGSDLIFYINSTSKSSYEISIRKESQNIAPEAGIIIKTAETNPVFSLNALKLNKGNNYLFCIREKCGSVDGEWLYCKWQHINDYAIPPYNLTLNNFVLSWEDSNQNPGASRYHVSYGMEGYDVNSEDGVVYSVHAKEFGKARLYPGITYDFYVQSYCDTIKGWSPWSGPVRLECTGFQEFCNLPSDVSYTLDFSDTKPFKINFRYETNGENAFQTVLVPPGDAIPQGNYPVMDRKTFPSYLVQSGIEFDFYVRTICNYHDTSEWTAKTRVKIP